MTKEKVLSSNMAATPLSSGSLGIGCKPPIAVFIPDRQLFICLRLLKLIINFSRLRQISHLTVNSGQTRFMTKKVLYFCDHLNRWTKSTDIFRQLHFDAVYYAVQGGSNLRVCG